MTLFHATVFDLDDTLVDSGEAWVRTCAAFTLRHGHRWSDEDTATLRGNGGWPSFLAGLCRGAVNPAAAAQECTDVMIGECLEGRVRPLPGAVDLVIEAGRRGPVGLASASPRRFVMAVIQSLDWGVPFSAVVCGEDVTRGKPAPEPYLRAAAELGVTPSRCLAVEDSSNGVRSASAAGMSVLAIPHGGNVLAPEVAALAVAEARGAADALPMLVRLFERPFASAAVGAAK